VRQIARRAREQIAARQSRVQVSRSEQQAVLERFLAPLQTGRLQELMAIMAPDVVLIAVGGALAGATLGPVHGAELVAKVLARKPVDVHVDDGVAPLRIRRPDRDRWRDGRG
jgi:hypothetical protein